MSDDDKIIKTQADGRADVTEPPLEGGEPQPPFEETGPPLIDNSLPGEPAPEPPEAGDLFEAHQQKEAERYAREEARAAELARTGYERVSEAPAANAGELAGRLALAFANENSFIHTIEPIDVEPAHLDWSGGHKRATFNRDVFFVATEPPATISAVWLVDKDGKGIACEVPGGLRVGGGTAAKIPANSLVF